LEIIDQAKKDGLWKDTIPEGMTLSELQKDFKTKKLSLMWNQRSVDTFLGLPFNIASYGLLLEILAKTVNMVPDELIGNLGDIHLYNNHIDQATEQISREIYDLPQLVINDEFWNPDVNAFEQIEYITPDDFDVINYKCHPRIKAPLSN
jgi:thymidylate synthase